MVVGVERGRDGADSAGFVAAARASGTAERGPGAGAAERGGALGAVARADCGGGAAAGWDRGGGAAADWGCGGGGAAADLGAAVGGAAVGSGRGATGDGSGGVLNRGAMIGAVGVVVTGRPGSGAGVLCAVVEDGVDEGVNMKIAAVRPTKPMTSAATPQSSSEPSERLPPRA